MLRNQRSASPKTIDKKETTSIQTDIPQNAIAFINRLPIEIIVIIIALAGDPCWKTPYPCIPFSSVCRQWRLAVLGNAVFWNIIVFDKRMTPDFLQNVVRRSQSMSLEVVVELGIPSFQVFRDGLATAAHRVKTFHMNSNIHHRCLHFSDLISFFPSLESIFYNTDPKIDLSFESSRIPLRLKSLRVSVKKLGSLAIPGSFPQLRVLMLDCAATIPLLSLLHALEHLPNLQILCLRSLFSMDSTTTSPTITLHKLKALFITESSLSRLIIAPKLAYLKIFDYMVQNEPDHFCGLDFSKTTDISFDIREYGFDITGKVSWDNSEADVPFHRESVELMPSLIPTFSVKGFCISLEKNAAFERRFGDGSSDFIPLFTACLEKATNLTNLALFYDEPSHSVWDDDELESLTAALEGATTVRSLEVSWDYSLATLCDFLSDSTVFPLLEKLTYYGDGEESEDSSDLLDSLQNLMDGRSTTCPRPLEVQLVNFPPVQSELLEQIANLGILLTQRNSIVVSETEN